MTDPRHLRDAIRRLIVAHATLDDAQRPCGARLSMPHAWALLELRADGPLTVSALADRLSIDRTNVSRLVERMVSSGEVTRVPHPDDRRARLVKLSVDGARLAESVDRTSGEHFGAVLTRLGDEPAAAVISALDALQRRPVPHPTAVPVNAVSRTHVAGCAVAVLALLGAACQTPPVVATAEAQTPPSPESSTADPPADDASATCESCAAQDELAAMDPRQPVPLLPMMAWHQKQNMMDHLVVIQEITDGLAREDWDAIVDAAGRIETSPQMTRMCDHMGAGAPGFTALALEFHARADTIAPAAEARDAQAVLAATSSTLQVCTSCHSTWRQEVVDAPTWQARTGSTSVPGGHDQGAGSSEPHGPPHGGSH